MAYRCGRRTKTCRKCERRYTKAEYELWECPECGEDRHCARTVAYEGKACSVHGGKSLKGVAHPGFKDGTRSEYLPARLRDKYEASLADEDLLNLRRDLALVETRIGELLQSLDAGESGQLWRNLNNARHEFTAAQRAVQNAGDNAEQRARAQADMAAAMQDILSLIGRGAADWERWKEIADFLERRRRLVESEQKRLVAMQQMVTAEQAMTLIASLGAGMREAVLAHVDGDVGRAILADVQRELVRATSAGAGREIS